MTKDEFIGSVVAIMAATTPTIELYNDLYTRAREILQRFDGSTLAKAILDGDESEQIIGDAITVCLWNCIFLATDASSRAVWMDHDYMSYYFDAVNMERKS